MLEAKSYEEFAAQVNTKFQLLEFSPILEIVLTEIIECKTTARQELFSLLFFGASEFALPQQTYEMKHEQLGAGALFLVPVGRDGEGIRYEAAFNRLRDDEQLKAIDNGD